MCFSPRHDLSLGAMADDDIRRVVELWADQTDELGKRYRWVQVFENRGAAMGASNPHPHGQIWAGSALPVIGAREAATQARAPRADRPPAAPRLRGPGIGRRARHRRDRPLAGGRPVLGRLAVRAAARGEAAGTHLAGPRRAERDDLARLLGRVLRRLRRPVRPAVPVLDGLAPGAVRSGDADAATAWQLHAHVYPPLLRASVRKFLVGYELLAETQRDFTPEEAAERLRSVRVASAAAPAPASAGEGSPG